MRKIFFYTGCSGHNEAKRCQKGQLYRGGQWQGSMLTNSTLPLRCLFAASLVPSPLLGLMQTTCPRHLPSNTVSTHHWQKFSLVWVKVTDCVHPSKKSQALVNLMGSVHNWFDPLCPMPIPSGSRNAERSSLSIPNWPIALTHTQLKSESHSTEKAALKYVFLTSTYRATKTPSVIAHMHNNFEKTPN